MKKHKRADTSSQEQFEEIATGNEKAENAALYKQSEWQRLPELALSSMTENVVFYDREMKIRWANRAACDFYRLPLAEMVGKTCHVLPGRSLENCRGCPVKKVLQTKTFQQEVLTSPENKTLLINAHPVWQAGVFSGVVEVSFDLTERTRIESELKQAKAQSVAASEAKSRFLANVSHEIRTPMNVILGMANLVYESVQGEEQKEYLGMIKDSASYLLTLVNDLLDLSKIEAGRLELAKRQFNLPRKVEKAVSSLNLRALEKGLQLSCSIDNNVPRIVTGDASRLQQVLFNLISNGIKFTEEGEVAVKVQKVVTGDSAGHAREQEHSSVALVLFSICDTGIGVPPDKFDSIFQSYNQLDTNRADENEGTGLGLPISKNLVELMGGSIGLKSVENKGSTFYFTIPFTLPQDLTGQTEELSALELTAPGGQASARMEKGFKILLVEDKPMNQKLVTVLLEKKGHYIIAAKNGREALDKLQAESFDLIIMDVHMPEMDGLEATTRIRTAEKDRGGHIPIIAMTAFAMQEDRNKCLKAGMDYYLSKPLDAEELYNVLEKIRRAW